MVLFYISIIIWYFYFRIRFRNRIPCLCNYMSFTNSIYVLNYQVKSIQNFFIICLTSGVVVSFEAYISLIIILRKSGGYLSSKCRFLRNDDTFWSELWSYWLTRNRKSHLREFLKIRIGKFLIRIKFFTFLV